MWVDRQGRETPLPAPPGVYRHPRLSPDGKRIAVDPHGGGQGDIYIWDLARPVVLGDPDDGRTAATTGFRSGRRTGDEIVFGSWRGGRFSNLYLLDLETGSTERLTDSPDMQLPTSITPDGTTVIFHSFTKSLQALRLRCRPRADDAGGDARRRAQRRALSGRALAGVRGRKPVASGTARCLRAAVPRRQSADCGRSPRDGGTFPLWSRNGRELFYVTLDGTIVGRARRGVGHDLEGGMSEELFRGPIRVREGSLGRS